VKTCAIAFVALAAVASAAQRDGGAAQTGPVAQADIDAALERGASFLKAAYAARLPKGKLDVLERQGQIALSLYTLLQSGVARDDAVVRELLHVLSKKRTEQTYDTACLALALYTHDRIDHRPWLDELAAQLIATQEREGDWSYPGSLVDLSNTQYAALGLWAASRAGVEIDHGVWTRMANAVLRYQTDDGGFGYTAGGKAGATGSMTAAGVGTLAICESRLRLANALDADLQKRVGAARKRGLDWLANRFSVETNPGSGGWHYYYLYGLERVGAVSGAPFFGPHDWYAQGSRWLLEEQDEKGSWNKGTDLSETCFALLFLRRATSTEPRRRGPVSGERPKIEGEPAPIVIAAEPVEEQHGALRFSIVDWTPALVQPHEWQGERGKGPHVARVEWFVDGELATVELGQPGRPAERATFAASPLFRSAGKHKVLARVVALSPDGAETALESRELEIEATRATPAWIASGVRNVLQNLAPAQKPKARASSQAKGAKAPFGDNYEPDNAVDGNARTPWLAAEGDEKRELSIQYGKGESCAAIVVRPAVLAPFGPEHLARPVQIRVTVNGKNEHVLDCGPDPLQPIELRLDPPVNVKRIDLKILSVAPSAQSPLVGIGEVELYAPSR